MQFIYDIIKGAMIGVANVIPGVSGGTVAVSMGIYDRLIFALTDIFRRPKDSLRTLVPVVIGCAVGIISFAYIIEFLLRQFALPTCLAFIGLILGGVPLLWRSYHANRAKTSQMFAVYALIFLAMFAISALLPMLDASGNTGVTAIPLPIWLFSGLIAAATMVIPGVSGSMVLMIMGYYYLVIGQIKAFADALFVFDFSRMLDLCLPLVFFGVGALIGIFGIVKCIRFLFEHAPGITYSAILGLVIGAPVAILYNTGSLAELSMPGGASRGAVGILLLVVAFLFVYLPDRKRMNVQKQ